MVEAPPTVAKKLALAYLLVEDIEPPVPTVLALVPNLIPCPAACEIVQPPAPLPTILNIDPWIAVAGRVNVTKPALSAIYVVAIEPACEVPVTSTTLVAARLAHTGSAPVTPVSTCPVAPAAVATKAPVFSA